MLVTVAISLRYLHRSKLRADGEIKNIFETKSFRRKTNKFVWHKSVDARSGSWCHHIDSLWHTPFFILPISLAIDGIQVYSISIIVYNRRATVMHVSNIYRFITSGKAMTSLSCQWPYPDHTECGLAFESLLNSGCCDVTSFNDSLFNHFNHWWSFMCV